MSLRDGPPGPTSQPAKTRMPRSTLEPTLDVVFKMLFAAPGSERSLKALLTAVLRPTKPIAEATVLNPEVLPKLAGDKRAVLDVLVRFDDGTRVTVEMQAEKQSAFRERALFYWSSVYAEQLERGHGYEDLMPVISVLFLDHRELAGARMHSKFRLLEVHDHEAFTDTMELHVIELPKRRTDREARQGDSALLAWCRFLGATTDEEVKEACVAHPDIEEANEMLEQISSNPQARALAEQRRVALAMYRMEMNASEAKGRVKGKVEGRTELLLELLQAKFGPIDDATSERVRTAPAEAIMRWSQKILTAATVAEALADD